MKTPKTSIPKISESTILHDIFCFLYDLHIGKVIRNNVGSYKLPNGKWLRYGTPGESDITLELSNKKENCYFEIKSAYGKATEKQLEFLEYQKERGHFTAIIKSVEECREKLIEWQLI